MANRGMKLIYSSRINSMQTMTAYNLTKGHTKEVIRDTIAKVVKTPNWELHHAESSVTFRNAKTGTTVKITCGYEVFVDRKLKSGSYKSEVHRFLNIENTAAKFLEVIGQYLQVTDGPTAVLQ